MSNKQDPLLLNDARKKLKSALSEFEAILSENESESSKEERLRREKMLKEIKKLVDTLS